MITNHTFSRNNDDLSVVHFLVDGETLVRNMLSQVEEKMSLLGITHFDYEGYFFDKKNNTITLTFTIEKISMP